MSALQGKVALITGGSSGIGLATAREFHAQGARVVLSGRDREKLEAVANQLGPHVLGVPTDVTKLSDLDELMARTQGRKPLANWTSCLSMQASPTPGRLLRRMKRSLIC